MKIAQALTSGRQDLMPGRKRNQDAKNNNQRAFIGVSMKRQLDKDELGKTQDELCLVAQSPDEIWLRSKLGPDAWNKDSGLLNTR
ncbi:hypothetical protein Tco_0364606 [Tanacetum coccineum]